MPNLNAARPMTVVSVRLHNGSQLNIETNKETKISELNDYLQEIQPSKQFKLVQSVSQKAINKDEMEQTVEQAGLCRSALS